MTAEKAAPKKDGLEAAIDAIEAEAKKAEKADEPGRTEDLVNLAGAKRALEAVARRREYRGRAS